MKPQKGSAKKNKSKSEEKENLNEAELENGVKKDKSLKKDKNAKKSGDDSNENKSDKRPSKIFQRVLGSGKRKKANTSVESAELSSSLQTSSPDQSNLTAETTGSDDNEGLNITFTQTPKFTRQYDYIEEVAQQDKKHKPVGGFTYEGKKKNDLDADENSAINSPSKKATGLAFNYAPGEAKKVADAAAEKRRALKEKNIDVTKPLGSSGDSKRETEKDQSGVFSSPGSLRERLSLRKDQSKETASSIKSPAKEEADKKVSSIGEGILTSEQIKAISKSLDKQGDKQESTSGDDSAKVLFKRVQKSEEESSLNRTFTTTTHRTYTDPSKAKDLGSPDDPKTLYSQVKKSGQPIKETEFGVDPTAVVTTVTSTDTLSSSFANTTTSTANSSIFSEKDHDRESIETTKNFITQERRNSSSLSDKSGTPVGTTPLIVKTTTKQTMVKDREGVTQNIEEKVEDLRSGAVTVSTQVNKVRWNANFIYLFFHRTTVDLSKYAMSI